MTVPDDPLPKLRGDVRQRIQTGLINAEPRLGPCSPFKSCLYLQQGNSIITMLFVYYLSTHRTWAKLAAHETYRLLNGCNAGCGLGAYESCRQISLGPVHSHALIHRSFPEQSTCCRSVELGRLKGLYCANKNRTVVMLSPKHLTCIVKVCPSPAPCTLPSMMQWVSPDHKETQTRLGATSHVEQANTHLSTGIRTGSLLHSSKHARREFCLSQG